MSVLEVTLNPTTSEIIAALDSSGGVEQWNTTLSVWGKDGRSYGSWKSLLAVYGNRRQYGYRIVYENPWITRVSLDRLPGRTLPGDFAPVRSVSYREGYGWRASVQDDVHVNGCNLYISGDGTVEVLTEDES